MLSVKGNSRAQSASLPPLRKYYLHVPSECRVYDDDRGAMLSDLATAHRRAVSLISKCMSLDPEEQDWRGWRVKIADDTGRTLVVVPFTTVQSEASDPHHTAG